MKSNALKIILPVLVLFLVGVSFGSFAGVAQAKCIQGACTAYTPYTYTYACTSYVCVPDICISETTLGYPPGCYPGGCYPYADTCSGTGYQCSSYAPDVCTCDNEYSNYPTCGPTCGTSSGSISCGDPAAAPYVGNRTVGTATYTYNSCTGVVTPNTSNCTAPVVAPTSAFISATPNPVQTTQSFTATWGPYDPSYIYTVLLNGVSYLFPSSSINNNTSWSGTLVSLGLGVGSYSLSVQACNSAGCASGSSPNLVVTAPVPTISFTAKDANNNVITSLPAGGGTVTLTWVSVNTTSCTASGAWSGAKATSGSQTVSLTSTATYDLTCQ